MRGCTVSCLLALEARPTSFVRGNKWAEWLPAKPVMDRMGGVLRQFCAKSLLPKTHDQNEASSNSVLKRTSLQ